MGDNERDDLSKQAVAAVYGVYGVTNQGPEIDIGGMRKRAIQDEQANAIYANVVARAYEKLVEEMYPCEAMPKAIERAEEVVRVWREVVKQ